MTSRLVIIALDPSQFVLLEKLGSVVPIWLVDSPSTQSIKLQWLNREDQQALLTWFQTKGNESATDALIRIAFTVDQHHDESSQQPPYDSLWVIGRIDKDLALAGLTNLGFSTCCEILGGTLFLKS